MSSALVVALPITSSAGSPAMDLLADVSAALATRLSLPYEQRRFFLDLTVDQALAWPATPAEPECAKCLQRLPLCEASYCHHQTVCLGCAPSVSVCAVCHQHVGAWTGQNTPRHILMKTMFNTERVEWPYSAVTVGDLKRLYQSQTGVPTYHQTIVYGAAQLPDDAVLAALGITSGALLHVVIRIMPTPKKR